MPLTRTYFKQVVYQTAQAERTKSPLVFASVSMSKQEAETLRREHKGPDRSTTIKERKVKIDGVHVRVWALVVRDTSRSPVVEES